ncbi:MAG: hypothetical protein K0R17_1018 [Rariglobus sp.]|jgi:hypothetical protein|nr:hypothetical protein [Rariglobus sp.]
MSDAQPTPSVPSAGAPANTAPDAPGAASSPPAGEERRADLDRRFLEAWLNRDDHRSCGQRLRPYCFQYALTLQLLKNPFVVGAELIGWADLFRAIAVCRAPFEKLPRFPSDIRLAWYVTSRRFLWWLSRGRFGTTFAREAAAFRAYQNDYQSNPDLFFENEGRELTAPIMLARAVYLMRVCGLPEERVWMMPIGKALWTYAAALEQDQSGVSLLDEEEGDLMEIIRKLQSGEMPLPPELQPEALNTKGAPTRINASVFGPDGT